MMHRVWPDIEVPIFSSEYPGSEFEPEIDSMVHKFVDTVEHLRESKNGIPRVLGTIENNLRPERSYVAHAAIVRFLDYQGLLGAFYLQETNGVDVTYDEGNTSDSDYWSVDMKQKVPGNRKQHETFTYRSEPLVDDPQQSSHKFTLAYQLTK